MNLQQPTKLKSHDECSQFQQQPEQIEDRSVVSVEYYCRKKNYYWYRQLRILPVIHVRDGRAVGGKTWLDIMLCVAGSS